MLVACGSPAAPTPASPAAPDDATAPTPASPTDPGVVEPTVRTPEQLARDAERAPLARAIVEAHANSTGIFSTLVAEWSPDGASVLYGSLRDGTPQIYLGLDDQPAAPPRALTTGPDRHLWARFTADGTSIVVRGDHDADENFRFWRLAVDGGPPALLTPADERVLRTEPLLPRRRSDILVYTESPPAETLSRVYEQSVTRGPPRLVYSTPEQGFTLDLTPDGARALFGVVRSYDDARVRELDLATGVVRPLYPPEGKRANLYSAAYVRDGARILVSTDEGGEAAVLLALDAATGAELARYTSPGPSGAFLNALVAPLGDRVIVHVDAGNHGELRVLDARTLTLERDIEVPLAELRLGSFHPDGRQFSLLISRPDTPADIFAVHAATGALRPLRDDPRPSLAALPKLTATIAVVPAHDGLSIPINVYLPATAAGEPVTRRQTIVSFHGGPSASSVIHWDIFVRFYTALGYAVLEPNVRGSTGFGRAYEMADNREKRAAWLRDLETVNAWTRAQPFCDPTRVVVFGGSYGGYTTLMALTRQPALWRAGVDIFGPTDLKSFLRTTDAWLRDLFVAEFGDLEQDGALLDEFSPMRDIDRIVAPLFVYTGQNDPRVPRAQSDKLVQALRDRGVPVEYMVAADEGHSIDRRDNQIELLVRSARFLADAMPAP